MHSTTRAKIQKMAQAVLSSVLSKGHLARGTKFVTQFDCEFGLMSDDGQGSLQDNPRTSRIKDR